MSGNQLGVGQQYGVQGQKAGINGTTFTPNLYLQGQLGQLYQQMGSRAPTNPFSMLGGGYMWQPPATNRSKYRGSSPEFPSAPKPQAPTQEFGA